MDRVTHTLLLVTLILVSICCLMWLLGGSCMAGYFSSRGLLPILDKDGVVQRVKQDVQDIVGVVKQDVRDVAGKVGDVAEEVKQRIQDESFEYV